MKLLIIDPDPKAVRELKRRLQEHGIRDVISGTQAAALQDLASGNFDALITESLLPDGSGLEVIKTLRKQGNRIPSVIISGRDELEERIEGLNAGADFYMTKPYAVEELVARLNALCRRVGDRMVVSQVEDLTVNFQTRQVMRGKRTVHLTDREFRFLAVLLRESPNAVTRTRFLQDVWGYTSIPAPISWTCMRCGCARRSTLERR